MQNYKHRSITGYRINSDKHIKSKENNVCVHPMAGFARKRMVITRRKAIGEELASLLVMSVITLLILFFSSLT